MSYYHRVVILWVMILFFSGATGCAGGTAANRSFYDAGRPAAGSPSLNKDYYAILKDFNNDRLIPHAHDDAGLDASVNALIRRITTAAAKPPYENAGAAVIPGSIMENRQYSRFEEIIIQRLRFALRRGHDLISLSRENWLAITENRPLFEKGESPYDFDSLLMFTVSVAPDPVSRNLKLRISAEDGRGKTAVGLTAETFLNDSPGEYTRVSAGGASHDLYRAPALSNPFPRGLAENPYASLDALAFSLSMELADAYHKGFTAGGKNVAAHEIRVLLYSAPSPTVDEETAEVINGAIQQALVDRRGFTCALGEKDLESVFRRISFYHEHKDDVFEMEEALFSAGTVLLTADISTHPDGDKIGVSLRAAWRVGPLESDEYELISANMSGTYISGFTAKAYIKKGALRPNKENPAHSRPQQAPSGATFGPISRNYEKAEALTASGSDMSICFVSYRDVYENRLYPALEKTPGVRSVERKFDECRTPESCACFSIRYDGRYDDFSRTFRQSMESLKMKYHHVAPVSQNRMTVVFDRGYE